MEMEERELLPCSLGRTGACPPALAVIASSQTDSTGLLPQNKKVKERGFFTSCLATRGGKYNQRHGNSSGVSAVQEPALPCGEPAGLQPVLQRLRAPEKGNRKGMAGLSNSEPRLGLGNHKAGTPQPPGVGAGRAPQQGRVGVGGSLFAWGGSLGSGIGCCHPARGQGLWPMAYHPRACRVGGLPSNPRIR